MPFAAFKTEEIREINELNNELRIVMKFEKELKICSIFIFWLLVASAYDLILG